MPLAKLPSGPSVAAMRAPVLAFPPWRSNSFWSRASSAWLPWESRSISSSPSGVTRANAQREAGTTRRIASITGYAGSDSGTRFAKSGPPVTPALSFFFTMVVFRFQWYDDEKLLLCSKLLSLKAYYHGPRMLLGGRLCRGCPGARRGSRRGGRAGHHDRHAPRSAGPQKD